MTRTRRISIATLIVAVIAGAALVVGSTTTAANTKSPTLKLRSTSFGKILVDKQGRTLYAFGHDKKNKSRCSGQCAGFWPPAKAPKNPTVAAGISKSKLKVIKRGDGS